MEYPTQMKVLPSAAWDQIYQKFQQPQAPPPPPPPPPTTTALCLRISAAQPVAAGGEVDVLLRLETPELTQGSRIPVDIICVLDISGSMSMEAKIQSSEGSGGLNLLDVAKHGVKTVMHALHDEDRLALVLFDNYADIAWELTFMTAEGRKSCEEKLTPVCTRGGTNIWNGLEEGLKVCRQGQGIQGDQCGKRLAHLILLTDGQTTGHNEVLPNMVAAKGAEERLPCTVSTFGFGYNIDSNLLVDMAHNGFGVYSFIPDAGFVGTVFVNYVSNLLSTMSLSAMLVVDPEGGQIQEVYGGLKVEDVGEGRKCVDLPILQYGQSKDVVLRLSVDPSLGPEAYLSANAICTLASGEELQTFQEAWSSEACHLHEVCKELWRLRFAHGLEQAVQMAEDRRYPSAALELLTQLSNEIEQHSRQNGYDQEQFILDLLQDLQGEATDAVAPTAFQKWGRHYLPSLMFAHKRQMCNNFKDPGVQHYGGEMFKELREEADEKFNLLPPPEPTNRSTLHGYTTPAVRSMAMYNDASAGWKTTKAFVVQLLRQGVHSSECSGSVLL